MPFATLTKFSAYLGRALIGASRDLAPIIIVIALFQVLVLHQPFPDFLSILAGLGLVIVGLALFVVGLDMGLFPLGEALAEEFARKGSLFWLLLFAFALGTGTTVAEPALIAVTREGAKAAAEAGLIDNTVAAISQYALGCPFDRGIVRWRCNCSWGIANSTRLVPAGFNRWRLPVGYAHDLVRTKGDRRISV